MAYLEVTDIQLAVSRPADERKENWLRIIEKNKREFEIDSMLIFPDVVYSPDQLGCIEVWEARPNFITSECVTGEVVLLENYENVEVHHVTKQEFTAIRCAEFNIPAAIGCGDCIYSFVEKQTIITLDCANGKIMKGE